MPGKEGTQKMQRIKKIKKKSHFRDSQWESQLAEMQSVSHTENEIKMEVCVHSDRKYLSKNPNVKFA